MSPSQLTELLHREIPLTRALGLHVLEHNEHGLTVTGPFEPNKNLHNTVFAGSIYCFATLAGWSLVHSISHQQNLKGSIVLHHAQIDYKRPITSDPTAFARQPDAMALAEFTRVFLTKGKAKLRVEVDLNQDDKLAARFFGDYVLLP